MLYNNYKNIYRVCLGCGKYDHLETVSKKYLIFLLGLPFIAFKSEQINNY